MRHFMGALAVLALLGSSAYAEDWCGYGGWYNSDGHHSGYHYGYSESRHSGFHYGDVYNPYSEQSGYGFHYGTHYGGNYGGHAGHHYGVPGEHHDPYGYSYRPWWR